MLSFYLVGWFGLALGLAAQSFALDVAKTTPSDKNALCPCMAKEHCPRIYGKSAMDIREMGFLPPCQDFGTVRCCGVSIRIEQDKGRQKVDWANFDIKSKNKLENPSGETNSVLQREDLLSAASEQTVQTVGGPPPRRTIVKLRRRKPFQPESKESSSQNSYTDNPSESSPVQSEINLETTTYSSAAPSSQQLFKSKFPNKNILNLRRPGQMRPGGNSNEDLSSSTNSNGDVQVQDKITTNIRPRPGLIGGRKKLPGSFTASVSSPPVTPSPDYQTGQQTLEIKEQFPSTSNPSSYPSAVQIPSRGKYIPKLRPFAPKPSTISISEEETSRVEEVTPTIEIVESSVGRTRPKVSGRRPLLTRPRRPNPEYSPEIREDTPLPTTSENPFNYYSSERTQTPSSTPAAIITTLHSSDPKADSFSGSFATISSNPDPPLTTKRPKYIRKRIRPLGTTEPSVQLTPSSTQSPITESPSENLDLVSTLTTTTNTPLPPTPMIPSTAEPESEQEREPMMTTPKLTTTQISFGDSVPSNHVSTQVSYSITKEIGNSHSSGEEENEENITSPPTPMRLRTTTSAPLLNTPMDTKKVRIYSTPSRGNYQGSRPHNKEKETTKYDGFGETRTSGTTNSISPPPPNVSNYREPVTSIRHQDSLREDERAAGKNRRFHIPSQFQHYQPPAPQEFEKEDTVPQNPFSSGSGELEGGESYDLVLNKGSRHPVRNPLLRQRQRFPTSINSQDTLAAYTETSSQREDAANQNRNTNYFSETFPDKTIHHESEEETRVYPNVVRSQLQRQREEYYGGEDNMEQTTAGNTRRNPQKIRKYQVGSNIEETPTRVVIPIPVAVPVPHHYPKPHLSTYPVTGEREVQTTTTSKPPRYRRIRTKPPLLQGYTHGQEETRGEKMPPSYSPDKTTGIINPQKISASEDVETSTGKFVFPPYRFQISSQASTPSTTEPSSSYQTNKQHSIGPLEVLSRPLTPNNHPNHRETYTEETYAHQIQPTESPYQSLPTTPITPAPTTIPTYKPRERYPNYRRNSSRFGVPQVFGLAPTENPASTLGPEVEELTRLRFGNTLPGNPQYVRFPGEKDYEERSTTETPKPPALPARTQTIINIDNTGLNVVRPSLPEGSILLKTPSPLLTITPKLPDTKEEEILERIPAKPTTPQPTLSGRRPYHEFFSVEEQLNPPQLTTVINITNGQDSNANLPVSPTASKTIPQVKSPQQHHKFPQVFGHGYGLVHLSEPSSPPFRFPTSPPPLFISHSVPAAELEPYTHSRIPYNRPPTSPPQPQLLSQPVHQTLVQHQLHTSEVGQGNKFYHHKVTGAEAVSPQNPPHYITEYHHHHEITQQILSRLRNSVRTSRATNLTLEDINWLTTLVQEGNLEEAEKEIEKKVGDESAVVDEEEENNKEIEEKPSQSTTNATTQTPATNLLEKALLEKASVEKTNNNEEEDGGKAEKTQTNEEAKIEEDGDKSEFRAPKMIRGFFPILPYSEEDPGPVLVSARALSLNNGGGRVSRDLGEKAEKVIVSLTTTAADNPRKNEETEKLL